MEEEIEKIGRAGPVETVLRETKNEINNTAEYTLGYDMIGTTGNVKRQLIREMMHVLSCCGDLPDRRVNNTKLRNSENNYQSRPTMLKNSEGQILNGMDSIGRKDIFTNCLINKISHRSIKK